jgi:hypothetical protein
MARSDWHKVNNRWVRKTAARPNKRRKARKGRKNTGAARVNRAASRNTGRRSSTRRSSRKSSRGRGRGR